MKRARRTAPTGVSSPAECAFASISDAIDSAEARGLGTGARIILTGATGTVPAVFAQESFPLAFPPGIAVTTTDDPALGGAGLDPTRYLVNFTGRAAYAADLEGGSLAGLTLKNQRASRATVMLICDAGTTAVDAVTLDGAGPSPIGRGLHLWPGCDLDATGVRVRGFAGNGVIVEEGSDLGLGASLIHNNGGDGLVIRGTVCICGLSTSSVIAFNGDDGILIERSPATSILNTVIRDNANNGVEVHPSNLVSFLQNIIHHNSYGVLDSNGESWNQPQMLFVGPATAGVPLDTEFGTFTAYPIGVESVDRCSDANRIFGYSSLPSPGAVGIRAIDGAVVDARRNWWQSAPKTTAGGGSFIATDPSCGGIGVPVPPGMPVE